MLSNDAATAILDGAIELRAEGRLGLLPLGHQYGEDTGHAAGQHTLLSERLVPHPAIGEIVRIPRLLLPDRLTVPAVREVAARLRCENVLLYQITFRRQYRHHMLARDRIRIFVTVEAVVFNTRTGIIPCSVVIDRDLDIPQQSGEKHWDLWQRAEAEAALAVLGDAAAQIMADLR